jgi:hypothetical protein
MRRVRQPESLMVILGRETAPIVPGVLAATESVEAAAVGGGCCDDGGVL